MALSASILYLSVNAQERKLKETLNIYNTTAAISQRTLFDTIEISRTAPIIHLTVRVFCQLLLVRSRLSFWSQIQAVCIKCNCEICHSFCYRFTTDSNKRLLIRSLKPLKFYPLSCTFGFSFLFILQSHA